VAASTVARSSGTQLSQTNMIRKRSSDPVPGSQLRKRALFGNTLAVDSAELRQGAKTVKIHSANASNFLINTEQNKVS
jgi:hypothetical protein